MERLVAVGVGGFIGAVLRYLVAAWISEWLGHSFPWSTLLINLTGSLLLGVFVAYVSGHPHSDPRLRLFIATGFFGAYTTFSTFANESIAMLENGNWSGGLGNIVLSNALCLLGAAIGIAMGGRL
jgi:fluoride exporter